MEAPSTSEAVATVATIRHTKIGNALLVVIAPRKGYYVSVMVGPNMQAFVYAEDGSETVSMKLDQPRVGQSVRIDRIADGTVNVVYYE